MFRILVVCSANICRSPYAAELLRAGTQQYGGDFSVTTAGTEASIGDPMCGVAESRLHEAAGFHSSRPLQKDLLETADLVLTAERRHRAAAVTMLPGAHAKVFTLVEADSLAAFVQGTQPPSSAASWLEAMDAARGRAPVASARRTRFRRARSEIDALDIPDGHGAGARAHGRALDSVHAATERLLRTVPWDTLRALPRGADSR